MSAVFRRPDTVVAIIFCRIIKGKDTRYKLYWLGNDKGTAGVGVFVAEEWIKFSRCRESLTESS